MLDYTFLQVFWWALIGVVLIIYATTAGYDSGVTMIMFFLRNETDRRVVLNTSAPVWDGNMTWIVFAGGGLFVVWPVLYALAFSGLYAAMFCILFAFFFRPTAFDYRGKINKHIWRRFWDFGLLVSGGLPVFVFGVAMGNCLLGFPFHFDHDTFRDYWTGNFGDLLSVFGILTGIVSVLMLLMHGAAYIQRRTEDHLRKLGHKLFYIFNILVIITFTIAGLLVAFSVKGYTLISSPIDPTLYPLGNKVTQSYGAWLASYKEYSWKYFPPVLTYLALVFGLMANFSHKRVLTFWLSVVSVGGIIATAGATLFPFLMPSSTNPSESLTVWNATSSQYSLDIMFYVGIVLLAIILCYKIFAFNTIWKGKKTISGEDLEKDKHTYY